MPLRVLLAEDEQIVRQGVRAILQAEGIEIVGEAEDGHAALRLCESLRPDIAVLDLAMPQLNGLGAALQLPKIAPDTKAILLTSYRDEQHVLEALRAGIRGYVLKTQATADLLQAIREVARGATYLSPGISEVVVDAYLAKREIPDDPLTPREREVLQLIAEGRTTKEVAQILGVSVKTAEFHRTRLMEKLDVHETASLVRYAIRRGVIQP
jgi:DNA-binding NarL/FixJ family response regulator